MNTMKSSSIGKKNVTEDFKIRKDAKTKGEKCNRRITRQKLPQGYESAGKAFVTRK